MPVCLLFFTTRQSPYRILYGYGRIIRYKKNVNIRYTAEREIIRRTSTLVLSTTSGNSTRLCPRKSDGWRERDFESQVQAPLMPAYCLLPFCEDTGMHFRISFFLKKATRQENCATTRWYLNATTSHLKLMRPGIILLRTQFYYHKTVTCCFRVQRPASSLELGKWALLDSKPYL
jgi:hypothetical protein